MKLLTIYLFSILTALNFVEPLFSSDKNEDVKRKIAARIEAKRPEYARISREIWEFAEPGYLEEKSSSLLQKNLEKEGFSIKSGVAEIPMAFVASYGDGRPVVGILAEYDALPGMSQDAVAERKALRENGPGHGCGHNLFGTGSMAAAIAVKEWLAESKNSGTIRLYGTPAEEGGSGKVYMVRAGFFDDVDVVLHWHPGDKNDASAHTTRANRSGKFRFYGVSSHAAGAPERGRSALDGVEAMNYMVNLLREHISTDASIHYVITNGGRAPNIVPDFAEVFYYVRHYETSGLEDVWERVVKAAEGAAKGTGTRVEYEVIHGNYNVLVNEALSKLVDENLRFTGGVKYTAAERVFAEAISKTLGENSKPLDATEKIEPYEFKKNKGSTDVGDVSWVVPTAGLYTATWVPGTAAHSWQVVAVGGMSIGVKGMMVASKTMALTAIDIFMEPADLEEINKEFKEKRGADFKYRALLGDRKPPLDYRK
jgi:aminobenzoyl-glutamate utilization protein B